MLTNSASGGMMLAGAFSIIELSGPEMQTWTQQSMEIVCVMDGVLVWKEICFLSIMAAALLGQLRHKDGGSLDSDSFGHSHSLHHCTAVASQAQRSVFAALMQHIYLRSRHALGVGKVLVVQHPNKLIMPK